MPRRGVLFTHRINRNKRSLGHAPSKPHDNHEKERSPSPAHSLDSHHSHSSSHSGHSLFHHRSPHPEPAHKHGEPLKRVDSAHSFPDDHAVHSDSSLGSFPRASLDEPRHPLHEHGKEEQGHHQPDKLDERLSTISHLIQSFTHEVLDHWSQREVARPLEIEKMLERWDEEFYQKFHEEGERGSGLIWNDKEYEWLIGMLEDLEKHYVEDFFEIIHDEHGQKKLEVSKHCQVDALFASEHHLGSHGHSSLTHDPHYDQHSHFHPLRHGPDHPESRSREPDRLHPEPNSPHHGLFHSPSPSPTSSLHSHGSHGTSSSHHAKSTPRKPSRFPTLRSRQPRSHSSTLAHDEHAPNHHGEEKGHHGEGGTHRNERAGARHQVKKLFTRSRKQRSLGHVDARIGSRQAQRYEVETYGRSRHGGLEMVKGRNASSSNLSDL
ncbi:uncharacterized protein JCM6883_003093 [Sporobolomyces salmoneus]|uniref:uncharacterized protein n=1 Tax=Sporobolomyces salmoneus TaxID=183962 RepID=UPI00317B94B3